MPVKHKHAHAVNIDLEAHGRAVKAKLTDTSNDAQLIACVRPCGLASCVFQGEELLYIWLHLCYKLAHDDCMYASGAAAKATLWQVQHQKQPSEKVGVYVCGLCAFLNSPAARMPGRDTWSRKKNRKKEEHS